MRLNAFHIFSHSSNILLTPIVMPPSTLKYLSCYPLWLRQAEVQNSASNVFCCAHLRPWSGSFHQPNDLLALKVLARHSRSDHSRCYAINVDIVIGVFQSSGMSHMTDGCFRGRISYLSWKSKVSSARRDVDDSPSASPFAVDVLLQELPNCQSWHPGCTQDINCCHLRPHFVIFLVKFSEWRPVSSTADQDINPSEFLA